MSLSRFRCEHRSETAVGYPKRRSVRAFLSLPVLANQSGKTPGRRRLRFSFFPIDNVKEQTLKRTARSRDIEATPSIFRRCAWKCSLIQDIAAASQGVSRRRPGVHNQGERLYMGAAAACQQPERIFLRPGRKNVQAPRNFSRIRSPSSPVETIFAPSLAMSAVATPSASASAMARSSLSAHSVMPNE